MNKTGWKDLLQRYHAATGLLHDRDQISSRKLKTQWKFCNTLRYGFGLGRKEDGTVIATDAWWEKIQRSVRSFVQSIYHQYFIQHLN